MICTLESHINRKRNKRRWRVVVMILFFTLFLFPSVNHATTWEKFDFLGSDKNDKVGVTYYVGTPVNAIDANTFRIWYKFVAEFGSTFHNITIEYIEINCKEKKRTILQRTETGDNSPKAETGAEQIGAVMYIEPGSIYDGFANNYCEDLKTIFGSQKSEKESKPNGAENERSK
ncbi:MAG: hypothetical protein HY203_03485 [Nitrospirae bacterium]|nr:hypothetical protein [Nitrospirota bacterium]